MKKFENKKTELENGVNRLGYADLAITCLNQIPQGGLGPLEMAERIKLINPLQELELDQILEIEDANFETLKKCVESTKWNAVHKDIVAFSQYIENLK